MGTLVGSAFYFILPAYVANAAPVIARALRLPGNVPVHERLLGSHKTIRGIFAGYCGALATLWCQWWLQTKGMLEQYRLLDYEQESILLLALLIGGGAIAGDMVKSFVKRRMEIPPGKSWFPFDQLDFVAGTLLLLSPVFILDFTRIVVLVFITPPIHAIANCVGYELGFKKRIEP